MPQNLTTGIVGSLGSNLTGESSGGGGGGSPGLTENETFWGAGSESYDLTGDLSSTVSAFTHVMKFRLKQLASSTYLFGNGGQHRVFINSSGNIVRRVQDSTGTRLINSTLSTGLADESVNTFMFASDGSNETTYLNGVSIRDAACVVNNGVLNMPVYINSHISGFPTSNAEDFGMIAVAVFEGYLDPDTYWSSFFDGADCTQDFLAGNAVGGLTPAFAESGDAAAWNALAGTAGTVTDA